MVYVMLEETWRDQFHRMKRSHERLLRTADSLHDVGSDDARDTLFHFFQDAYHLKDWLKNADPPVLTNTQAVERFVKASEAMRICTDLCNGLKHSGLNDPKHPPRTGDKNTAVTTQSVTVRVGAGIEHAWTTTSNVKTQDALDLAAKVIADWEGWLARQRLL
jgi:hypothetical protein